MWAVLPNCCSHMSVFPSLFFAVVVFMGLCLNPATGFNLEPRSPQTFSDPTRNEPYWGRESYFGYSIAIQGNPQENKTWLLVGAPRANSSFQTRFPEPGAIFKCDLRNGEAPCKEMVIEVNGGRIEAEYRNKVDHGWMGAVLDSQPFSTNVTRQTTATCAPRWVNDAYSSRTAMNGVCYWLNAELNEDDVHKKTTLSKRDKQGRGDDVIYACGQMGMSLHFPDNQTEMIIGAPGIQRWRGSVIQLTDEVIDPSSSGGNSRRRRRQVDSGGISEDDWFSLTLVPDPNITEEIQESDLNGYSVTSGRFFDKQVLLYASGSPRGADSVGQVKIFSFPDKESEPYNILAELNGSQLGEYFGASLVSADVNGDGLSDLVVGSPMYSEPGKPDVGRVHSFTGSKNGIMVPSEKFFCVNFTMARFGTTLASLGDLDNDGYEDIAVGAPWENGGKGAVYIYMGSKTGLQPNFMQHLSQKDFLPQQLSGFGMAISRGIDIDNNGYPDLAIGSFLSGHAVVLRSRPVATFNAHLTSSPKILHLEDTSLNFNVRIEYGGYRVPQKVGIIGSITLDNGYSTPRASFNDTGLTSMNFSMEADTSEAQNLSYQVNVQEDKIDARTPIKVKLDYRIAEDSQSLVDLPTINLYQASSWTFPIHMQTGCEVDGDIQCSIDMKIETAFVNLRVDDQLTIGDQNKPVMEIAVSNLGEPVFLPNVTISVGEPFTLSLPESHHCDYNMKNNSRSSLICQLSNPIKKDQKDIVQVTIDDKKVDDTTGILKIDVRGQGEGVELEPQNNIFTHEYQLTVDSELQLKGFSNEEVLIYHKIGENEINTTIAESTFTHTYILTKSGNTPLNNVGLMIDIPVNFTNGVNIVTLYSPKTSFLGDEFMCSVDGINLAVDQNVDTDGRTVLKGMDHTGVLYRNSRKKMTHQLRPGSAKSKSSPTSMQKFNCLSNSDISCARMNCMINSWPTGRKEATLSFKMDVNFTLLASRIFAGCGAVLSSTASASILSLNPNAKFIGKSRETTLEVLTYILPKSMASQGVAWWIILLAILGGLLLVGLVTYALYKKGFFVRKEQEKLKAERAELVPAATPAES